MNCTCNAPTKTYVLLPEITLNSDGWTVRDLRAALEKFKEMKECTKCGKMVKAA